MVEKRWRSACKSDNDNSNVEGFDYAVYPSLPTDSEFVAAFIERRRRYAKISIRFILYIILVGMFSINHTL